MTETIRKIGDFFVGTAYAQPRDRLDFFNLGRFINPSSRSSEGIFSSLVANLTGWILAIVGLVAFFYLIVSGFNYITAGGDAAKAGLARTGIINAIIGVIVVLLAYVIVRFAFGFSTELKV